MRNFLRGFIALWYLLGWMIHFYLALFSPATYEVFGHTSLIPGYDIFWQNLVMPHITFFALLLAAFEITVGLMLINKGKWVKYGLILSTAFNLFLVQMGLASTDLSAGQDFLTNRLPNLVFIALQLPLFWGSYEDTLLGGIHKRLSSLKNQSQS